MLFKDTRGFQSKYFSFTSYLNPTLIFNQIFVKKDQLEIYEKQNNLISFKIFIIYV